MGWPVFLLHWPRARGPEATQTSGVHAVAPPAGAALLETLWPLAHTQPLLEHKDGSRGECARREGSALLFSEDARVPALRRLGSVQALSLRHMLSLSPFSSPGPGAHCGGGEGTS